MTTTSPGIGTDLHNLACVDCSVNSARSNKMYDFGGHVVIDNSPPPGYHGSTRKYTIDALSDADSFEPPDAAKGFVARAVFYMASVYSRNDQDQPFLNLGEDSDAGAFRLGKLSTLLQWNSLFPPTSWEKTRNCIIAKYQGNKNPFIDTPSLANHINWCTLESSPPIEQPLIHNGSTIYSVTPFVNEIHYDNHGRDTNEGVEVVIPLHMDPSRIQIVLYNGADQKPYTTHPRNNNSWIPGNIYREAGVQLFYVNCRLQNGPDGIALVNTLTNTVYQFISYENTFTAVSGPAMGMLSCNINVNETHKTTRGTSIQLCGTGRHYNDFKWESIESPSNWGTQNQNQAFQLV